MPYSSGSINVAFPAQACTVHVYTCIVFKHMRAAAIQTLQNSCALCSTFRWSTIMNFCGKEDTRQIWSEHLQRGRESAVPNTQLDGGSATWPPMGEPSSKRLTRSGSLRERFAPPRQVSRRLQGENFHVHHVMNMHDRYIWLS